MTRATSDTTGHRGGTQWRPRHAVWEITLACNLRCRHCGSRAGAPRVDELSSARCRDVVAQLAACGTELVTLSGGEPTQRADWAELAAALTSRGVAVTMVTNGVFRSDDERRDIVGRCRDAGVLGLGVSLDGPADAHEWLRGRHHYQPTVAFIEACARAGLPVTVLCTAHRGNLTELERARRLAGRAGAVAWRVQLALPMGKAADRAELVLGPSQYVQLMNELARLTDRPGIPLEIADCLGYFGAPERSLRRRRVTEPEVYWSGCQAGLSVVGIEANGDVKGCLALQASLSGDGSFVEGNLTRQSLDEIWHRPDGFAYNRRFDVEQLAGHCRHCRHAHECRGGARCVAAALRGDVSEDPYCYFGLLPGQSPALATRPISTKRPPARSASVSAALLLTATAGCGATGGAPASTESAPTATTAQPPRFALADCGHSPRKPALTPPAGASLRLLGFPHEPRPGPQPMYGVQQPHPVDYLRTGQPERAIPGLLEAYAVTCDPRLLLPLGQALQQTSRLQDALVTWQRYLDEMDAGNTPAEPPREEVEQRIRLLESVLRGEAGEPSR